MFTLPAVFISPIWSLEALVDTIGWRSDIMTETICLHQQKLQSSDSGLHNTANGDS